jgi:hypothetical protein
MAHNGGSNWLTLTTKAIDDDDKPFFLQCSDISVLLLYTKKLKRVNYCRLLAMFWTLFLLFFA